MKQSVLAFIFTAFGCLPATASIYQTNFDSLIPGKTSKPANPGQGHWTQILALGGGFGEIQNVVAVSGQALHEFSPSTNPVGLQTIDQRPFTPSVGISGLSVLTLSTEFLATSSDYSLINPYSASMELRGGPFPGFQILGFDLFGGNGSTKLSTGVNVGLSTFNGVDNNQPASLSAGQDLKWGQWHSVSVSANLVTDTYTSLTVDGVTQNLTGTALPRSFLNNVALPPGQQIDFIQTQVVASPFPGIQSDDSVYWDNLTVSATPEPSYSWVDALGVLGLVVVPRKQAKKSER